MESRKFHTQCDGEKWVEVNVLIALQQTRHTFCLQSAHDPRPVTSELLEIKFYAVRST